ncbi:hypothetical protein GcC1_130009 [Golovinomyces cichoracearum]|uniref:Uncharacterized protein n=1 Tax=Golovinomyces cichoracearum TaxID=62708 RepID=A0A420I4M9_9PEZI|nr:hypothetical protein GcC1_130009 [Golovinomyces cichoracearum]
MGAERAVNYLMTQAFERDIQRSVFVKHRHRHKKHSSYFRGVIGGRNRGSQLLNSELSMRDECRAFSNTDASITETGVSGDANSIIGRH